MAPDRARDDRVLPYTRGLSMFIAPFLLVGFALLYLFPGDTRRLFAWTIHPTMTPMVLASAYLGGFYFFVSVLRERGWATVKGGFAAVALFATLLGVATVIHWDKFNHRHVAFWLWAALYFAAPLLVVGAVLTNQQVSSRVDAGEQRLRPARQWAVALTGTVALLVGMAMFLAPAPAISVWPWALTPLTCRVLGAVLCLGAAGLVALVDPRWVCIRLLVKVELVMVALMAIAGVRARHEFITTRPLTWLMLVGFSALVVGSVALWRTEEIRSGDRR